MSVTASARTYEVAKRDVPVLRALLVRSMTITQLVSATGYSASTVRTAVKELSGWQLVFPAGKAGRAIMYGLTVQGATSAKTLPGAA